MARSRPEELSGHNRLNEQQKQEILLLREELKKANYSCAEFRAAAKKANAEMSSYKKEHDNEFNTLKKALEDSQKVIEALRERLNQQKGVKDDQKSFDTDVYTESDGATDRRSLEPAQKSQVSELQRELDEMHRKNGELRRTLTDNIQLVELNRQLKQDLQTSQQKNKLLGKQVEDKVKQLDEMTSEVSRLGNELDRAHAVSIDYASQLKALRHQGEETAGHPEDLVGAKNVKEKLENEIKQLRSSLEKVEKKNEE